MSALIEHNPDLRLGQLIANLAVIARGPAPEAILEMHDEELIDTIKKHVVDYDPRQAEVC